MENARFRQAHGEHPGRTYPPPGFGPAITAARNKAGLGLREAARAAGIPPGYWCLLEHGERSPSVSVAEAVIRAVRADAVAAEAIRDAAVIGVGRDFDPDPAT